MLAFCVTWLAHTLAECRSFTVRLRTGRLAIIAAPDPPQIRLHLPLYVKLLTLARPRTSVSTLSSNICGPWPALLMFATEPPFDRAALAIAGFRGTRAA